MSANPYYSDHMQCKHKLDCLVCIDANLDDPYHMQKKKIAVWYGHRLARGLQEAGKSRYSGSFEKRMFQFLTIQIIRSFRQTGIIPLARGKSIRMIRTQQKKIAQLDSPPFRRQVHLNYSSHNAQLMQLDLIWWVTHSILGLICDLLTPKVSLEYLWPMKTIQSHPIHASIPTRA